MPMIDLIIVCVYLLVVFGAAICWRSSKDASIEDYFLNSSIYASLKKLDSPMNISEIETGWIFNRWLNSSFRRKMKTSKTRKPARGKQESTITTNTM